MAVKPLPCTPVNWDCDNFAVNVGIQNILARTRYQELSKTFSLLKTQNKTKYLKAIRLHQSSITWMNHFKQNFKRYWAKYWLTYGKIQRPIFNGVILENETHKIGILVVVRICYFHWLLIRVWFISWSEGSVAMQFFEKLKVSYCTLFLTAQHWSVNLLRMEFMP